MVNLWPLLILDWPVMPFPAAAIERAALSIGRLDAGLDGHPLRLAWEHRTRLRAAIQAMRWSGRHVDADRLASLLAGIPLRVRDVVDMAGAGLSEHRALVLLDFLTRHGGGTGFWSAPPHESADDHRELAELDDDLAAFIEVVNPPSASSALIAIAEAAWIMRREADSRPIILAAAVPITLARSALTRAGILPGLAAYPPLRPREEWIGAFLDGLGQAADEGLARLRGLTVTFAEWQARIGPRQKNSRLPRLLAAAMCQPFLSPIGVQRLLGTSLPGASKLLAQAVAAGILVEATGRRGSHTLYLSADWRANQIQGRIPGPAPHPQELSPILAGQALDALLGDVDAALRRSSKTLAAYGIRS